MTTRRLATILAADVVGFSSMMERDEEGALELVKALLSEIVGPAVEKHHGRIFKTTGDGVLVEFASPVEAVRCAVGIQKAVAARSLRLRIGVNLGDIIIEPDGDVYGDGVNIAARLEGIADPGSVCISGAVYDQIEGKIDRAFESRGEQRVKNILKAVRVYALAGVAVQHAVPEAKPLPLPDKPSIAVLPFTNMSADSEQEYFADGVVEDIITALSRFRWLFVIARASSFAYKGRSIDLQQVGRELGVRYILEGSMRRAGSRVRITAQLVEAATRRHIWSERFDGTLEDIFDLQDSIASSVVGAIEPSLRRAEVERAQLKPTESLDAYDLYLRALPELNAFTKDGYTRAEELLRQALDRDPNFADAWAALANVAFSSQVGGWITPAEARAIGREAALRAVKADPDNAFGLAAAAATLAMQGGDLVQATEYAERALSLNRNSAQVLIFCALTFNFDGQPDKALELTQAARRISPLDPRSFMIFHQMAQAHLFSRRFDQAVQCAARAVEENPNFTPARRVLAAALAYAGRDDEARRAIEDLLAIQPTSNLRLSRQNSYRHPWMVDLFVDGLRRAGLPE